MKTFRKSFIKTKLLKETSAKETFRESFAKVKLLGKASAKKPLEKASSKAQSAMEYLMTYGWAILIIAVVLGALFELGVFNANNFAPKAPPGACQVFRPNGPGTTSFINLEGICTGEIPQYVAQFNGNGYITINIPNIPTTTMPRTITAWLYTTNFNQNLAFFGYGTSSCDTDFYAAVGTACANTGPIWVDAACTCQVLTPPSQPSGWSFVVYEYNGTAQIAYLGNGGSISSKVSEIFTANTPNTPFYIGTDYQVWNSAPIVGEMANVQFYNTSLSTNEIQALYLEGIGGAPIDLQHLIGWWPLNGNANDYSGNGNNGQISGTINFVSNWYSGYTPP